MNGLNAAPATSLTPSLTARTRCQRAVGRVGWRGGGGGAGCTDVPCESARVGGVGGRATRPLRVIGRRRRAGRVDAAMAGGGIPGGLGNSREMFRLRQKRL